jgi:WD40 repeat protein
LNPITALAYYKPAAGPLLLLAGEGTFLKVFEAETSTLVAQCQVFDSQTIHGIVVRDEPKTKDELQIVIWGGRSFVLLSAKDAELIISRDTTSLLYLENAASDWLFDAAISPFDKSGSCIFVTAHSVTLHVEFRTKTRRQAMRALPSASQSILYSAHVVWTSASAFMIAAGTVFGEIEILATEIGQNGADGQCELLFTFTGHEGSIFGVQISPEIIGPDCKPTRLLVTCSDDRSIRLWDLSQLPKSQINTAKSDAISTVLKDTGFGGDRGPSSSAERCLAVAMGHSSRIWSVHFIAPKTIEGGIVTPLNILSFGEDSTVQQWSLNGWTVKPKLDMNGDPSTNSDSAKHRQETSKLSLVLKHSFAYHTGKHLWSNTLLQTDQYKTLLATGGADGKISEYDIWLKNTDLDTPKKENNGGFSQPEDTEQNHKKLLMLTLDNILEHLPLSSRILGQNPILSPPEASETKENTKPEDSSPDKKKKKKKPVKLPTDSINTYGFLTKEHLVLTTNFGRILSGSVEAPHDWKELDLPEGETHALKSYSIILGVPEYGVVFLAAANGSIYGYSTSGMITKLGELKGKISNLFYISATSRNEIHILATVLGQIEARLLSFNLSSFTIEEVKTIELPPPFLPTSAAEVDDLLILGARTGYLAVYQPKLSKIAIEVVWDEQLHLRDAVASIIEVPKKDGVTHFLITTREGSYAIFSLVRTAGTGIPAASVSLVHQSKLPFGPIIEAAWFGGSSLLLSGFRSKNFIVWNETAQCEIYNIDCGGAHRTHVYQPHSGANGAGYFVYSKAATICIYNQVESSHKIIKSGGHGREIKACATSSKSGLIATAAEDTNIRLWRYKPNSDCIDSNLECLVNLQKHSAGIHHLQWASSSDAAEYLFSAGGYEEFNAWKVSDVLGFGLGVVCEATLLDLSEERDLRIMSFDVVPAMNYGVKETEPSETSYVIGLALSDSTIRIYSYSNRSGFKRIAQGRYTSSCLTELRFLPSPDGYKRLLTASTDGYIAIWEFSPKEVSESPVDIQLIGRTRVHQSSVLALDILLLGPEDFIIATGGDDNALGLTFVQDWEVKKKIIIPSAHAAAVTGVAFLNRKRFSSDAGLCYQICTVGGDQRMKRWTVELFREFRDGTIILDIKMNQMLLGDKTTTTVPDAAGLELLQDSSGKEHCLVHGNGLQIFAV